MTHAHTSPPRHLSGAACARTFLAWLPGGKGTKGTIVVLVATALIAGVLAVMALPSRADQTTFTVTKAMLGSSTSTSGSGAANNDADTNPGDGSCLAYAGGCTLKAAIQEANAEYKANSNAGPFLINFDPSVQGTSSSPTLIDWPTNTTGWMTTAQLSGASSSNRDAGAVYMITAPVTLDLSGIQLGHLVTGTGNGTQDGNRGAWFDIAGPNITIQNFWGGIYASESSIVVASAATNFVVQNGAWTPDNYYPERFLTMQTGVNGVKAQNIKMSGGYAATNSLQDMGGYFNFTNSYSGTKGSNFSNIQIGPNIQITQAISGGSCSGSSNSGNACWNSIIAWDDSEHWDDEPYGSSSGNGTNAVPKANPTWAFNGFTFTGNTVNGLPNSSNAFGMCFASGDGGYYTVGPSSNFTITNNVFTNIIGSSSTGYYCNQSNSTYGAGLIVLPRFLSGTNTISGNVFQSVATGKSNLDDAIRYFGNAKTVNNTVGSGLTIRNNYFDGWKGGSVLSLVDAGLVTVEGNTFGPNNDSQSDGYGMQEEYASGVSSKATVGQLVDNYSKNTGYATGKQTTNQAVRSWAPSATATVLTTPAPAGSLSLTGTPNALVNMSTCPVSLNVSQVTDTSNNTQATKGLPVNVGVYWTGARTAEVFLGHAQVISGTSATLTVPLPVGDIAMPLTGTAQIAGSSDLPAPAAFSAGSAKIVDPGTGAVQTGYLRLQTQLAAGGSQGLSQNESSQYSRWVGITGTCAPAVTISQNATYNGTPADGSPQGAPAQGFSAMSRARVFTMTSTVPLDPASVTASSFTVSGTAPGAKVVSVTPVTGSNNTQFTVVTQANDSGTIVLAVPTGAVATTAGLKTTGPSVASTTTVSGTPLGTLGDTLSYTNPLTVTPTTLAMVTGEGKGKSYSISLKTGAPVLNGVLEFSAAQAAGDAYALNLSTNSPSIAVDAESTSVTVQAPAGTVPLGGVVDTIKHSLSSTDPNYDGLTVPSVKVVVYSTDPYISIEKEVFTGVAGGSAGNTVANIQSTGTQMAKGGTLSNGQNVWFVFHVCNISAQTGPSWVTDLTGVQVNDDVLGPIGEIASLPAGTATNPGCEDLVYAGNPVAISANQ